MCAPYLHSAHRNNSKRSHIITLFERSQIRAWKFQINRMDARCANIWSPADARSEESEMIDQLKSMFWSGTDAEINFYSPDSSVNSCVTTSTMPSSLFLPLMDDEGFGTVPLMVSTGMDMCSDHQHQVITGNKRMFPMDEHFEQQQKKPKKKTRTSRSVGQFCMRILIHA